MKAHLFTVIFVTHNVTTHCVDGFEVKHHIITLKDIDSRDTFLVDVVGDAAMTPFEVGDIVQAKLRFTLLTKTPKRITPYCYTPEIRRVGSNTIHSNNPLNTPEK